MNAVIKNRLEGGGLEVFDKAALTDGSHGLHEDGDTLPSHFELRQSPAPKSMALLFAPSEQSPNQWVRDH